MNYYKKFIHELLNELAFRTPSGMVDFKDKTHRSILSEILVEWGLDELKDELINNLIKEADEDESFSNPDLNKIIQYKGTDGTDKEGMVGNLLRQPKDTPPRDAAERALGNDPARIQKAMQDLGAENAPKGDTTTGDQGGEQMAEPERGTALNPNTKAGKDYVEQLPDNDPAAPHKPKDIKQDAKIPDYQIDYYQEVAKDSAPRIQNTSTKTDRRVAMQALYAKLQLISLGSEEVDLDENDIANLSKMVISGNARSGQLYDSSFGLSKAEGIQSVQPNSPNYANRNLDKNELLNNWKNVVKYMDSKEIPRQARPKFKVGANTLIDNPPKIDHNPVSMKPNRMMDKVQKTPANKLISTKTIADLKEKQGIEIGNDDLFGEPLDVNNPKSFLNNIGLVINASTEYIDSVDSPDTKAYFDKFNNGINSIINSGVSDDEKLQKINEQLPKLFTQLYHDALEVSEPEAKNVLKDFGELVVYMDFLSQKKEVYLPVSGNYPLADVIVVRRDGNGDALTLDGVSIKSQKGNEEQPGSSAMEFCKHFANTYPQHKKIFDSLGALHTNSIDSVKMDNIQDDKIRKDIEKIQSLENMKSFDDAKKVCDELGVDWTNIRKKIATQYAKYKNELKEMTAENMRNVAKELIYRKYSFDKTLDTFNDLNLDTKLKFVEVVVKSENIAVRQKGGDSTTADFRAHDKGYLGKGDIEKVPPPPHVGQVKYQSANMALRYKPNKTKIK